MCSLFQQPNDLVDLCAKQVQTCEDTAVGAEVKLLHYFFVVYTVANVDVRSERDMVDGRIQVDDIRRSRWSFRYRGCTLCWVGMSVEV